MDVEFVFLFVCLFFCLVFFSWDDSGYNTTLYAGWCDQQTKGFAFFISVFFGPCLEEIDYTSPNTYVLKIDDIEVGKVQNESDAESFSTC